MPKRTMEPRSQKGSKITAYLSWAEEFWSNYDGSFGPDNEDNEASKFMLPRGSGIDVPESHDQFCNNKQAEKASLELAVNALVDGVAACARHLIVFFNNLVESHRHAAPAASSSSLDNRPSQGQAETQSLLS
ncbi:unnamed protein product [Penicillium viridicatum]